VEGYVPQTWPGVRDWLASVRDGSAGWGRWRYHAAQPEPSALQASGIAVGLFDQAGELDAVPEAQRQEAIDFFRSCQDPTDGLFKDPLETEARHTGHHSWEQVWGQRHGAAVSALRLLGGEPAHPIPAAQFVDLREVDGRTFTLERIDWSNPWGHGESWARAIRAYLSHLPADERGDRQPVLREAFEACEQHILDPATGMPSRRMPEPDPSRAMAGLFKVMFAYLAVGRAVPHAERAIDFVLDLQHADGEFGYRGNMCINWDSVWVLRHLDMQVDGGHRHEAIAAATRRLADRLLDHYLKPDGAFAFHGEHCQTNHHSIRLCDEPQPIGDMLGTMMCLKCLRYADEYAADEPPREPDAELSRAVAH